MLNNGCLNSFVSNSLSIWELTPKIFINELVSKIDSNSIQIDNPDERQAMFYTDLISINETFPIVVDTNYVLSAYTQGDGVASLQLRGYTRGASGVNNITDFYLCGYSDEIVASSGLWTRNSLSVIVPSGVAYMRAFMTTSGQWLRADGFQLEQADIISSIEEDFVGDLILPKRMLSADIGFNNENVQKFTGLIDTITPDLKNDTVSIHAYDLADKTRDFLVTSELFENKRTDELIAILADMCGIDATKRSLDVGLHVCAYAWFPEASAWTYMQQLAEAEGGRIFFDEDGKLTFWNRSTVAYSNNTPVYNFTIDKNILDIKYSISKRNIKNKIIVSAKPKTLITGATIYEDTTSPSIEPGETKEFWCQFSHGDEISVPAVNVEYPVLGVDIKGNTESDGSGFEVISQMQITSWSIFAESFRINIKNNYASTIYLYFFELYGDAIVIEKDIEVISQDLASQTLYDVQELAIENNFIDSEVYAKSLADHKLAVLKDSRNFLEIDCIGAPHLQVGDCVSVEKGFDKIVDNFTIIKNQWKFDGDFTQKLTLEKKQSL